MFGSALANVILNPGGACAFAWVRVGVYACDRVTGLDVNLCRGDVGMENKP